MRVGYVRRQGLLRGVGGSILLRLLAVSVAMTALMVASAGDSGDSCVGLLQPVDGRMASAFAPIGRYAGHWGVDWVVPEGTAVRAAGVGTVSFAGSVAGNLTATVDHGGGLRTSYSYLATVAVKPGQLVTESTTLGHERDRAWCSGASFLRAAGRNVCRPAGRHRVPSIDPVEGPATGSNSRGQLKRLFCRSAQGHSWRNIRPTSRGSPDCR